MTDFNCKKCNRDLIPLYGFVGKGGKLHKSVSVEQYHEVFDGEVTRHEWITNIKCPSCGTVLTFEDGD